MVKSSRTRTSNSNTSSPSCFRWPMPGPIREWLPSVLSRVFLTWAFLRNGSQFFITTVVTSWLNGKHVVFGILKYDDKESAHVVKSIEATGSAKGDIKYSKAPTIIDSGKLQ